MDTNQLLGKEKVSKLLLKLSIPAIIAQLVNLLYNVIDRIYIGHIADVGGVALPGVGVTLPLIVFITAFASLIGMGGSARASISMGEHDNQKAEKYLGNSFSLVLIIGTALILIFQFFSEPLLELFGATPTNIVYALPYLKIYSLGTFFVLINVGLNAFISAQGFAKTSMLTVLIGAIVNILLDPLFIFVFHLGVEGAAIATIIAQGFSSIFVIYFLTSKKTVLHLKLKNFIPSFKAMISIILLGLSPFIMQATEGILTICFNTSIVKYAGSVEIIEGFTQADASLGAMTILASVMQFMLLPILGLAQGAQPITSYNFGEKNKRRVVDTVKLLILVSFIYTFCLCLIVMIFPSLFASLFTNNEFIKAETVRLIRVYMFGTAFFGIQVACQQTFVAIGNVKTSIFIAIFRKILLLIPLIYIIPLIYTSDQVMGVILAEPIADIISVIVASCLFYISFKKAIKTLN